MKVDYYLDGALLLSVVDGSVPRVGDVVIQPTQSWSMYCFLVLVHGILSQSLRTRRIRYLASVRENGRRRVLASLWNQSITCSILRRICSGVHASNVSCRPSHPQLFLSEITVPNTAANRDPTPEREPSTIDSNLDISSSGLSLDMRVRVVQFSLCDLGHLVQALHSCSVGKYSVPLMSAIKWQWSVRCGQVILSGFVCPGPVPASHALR